MIVYLHGFNSSGNAQKAAWLRRHCAPIVVFAPTYEPHRPQAAARALRKFIARLRRENPRDRKLMLIGSSLGGFWAQYLAQQNWGQSLGSDPSVVGPDPDLSIVLINPSVRPYETLMRHVGWRFPHPSGCDTVLTTADVAALRDYRVEPCDPRVPTLVLLDEGDEVLDYRAAQAAFRGCGTTRVWPGGSHRFEHLAEALPGILALYRGCIPAAILENVPPHSGP